MRRAASIRYISLILSAAFLISCRGWPDSALPVRAEAGRLDLSKADFSDDALFTLNGDWEFRSGCLAERQDFLNGDREYFTLGGSADGILERDEFKKAGTATFRLFVDTGLPNRTFGILLPNLSGASRLWLNGKLSLDFGTLCTDPKNLKTRMIGGIAGYVVSDAAGGIEILFQTADRNFRNWNIVQFPPRLGLQGTVSEKIVSMNAFHFFILGGLFFIFLHHFALYCRRKKDSYNLFFSLFILVLGLRILLFDNLRLVYFALPISTSLYAKMLGLFIFPLMPLFLTFILLFFPADGRIGVLKPFGIASAVFLLLSILVPPEFQDVVFFLYYPVVILSMLYTAKVLVSAGRRGRRIAFLLLAGFIVFALVVLQDLVMARRATVSDDYFSALGILVFLVFHSLVINRRVSEALENVERLSTELKEHQDHLGKMVEKRTLQLRKANKKLEALAHRDGLTKLYNRRFFDTALEREWKRLLRNEKPIAVMLADVDFFKPYNDRYGHQKGDECLKMIARVLEAHAKRPSDIAARYGGEEFVLVLPETDLVGGNHIAEAIRREVESLGFLHDNSPFGRVTLSAGVASTIPSRESSYVDLVRAADELLYEAKQHGRNRVLPALQVLEGERLEHP